MVEAGFFYFLCVLKQNWEVQKSPSPAAWTHTASHLPTSSAAQGQDAQQEEPGAGAILQEPSPLTFLLMEAMNLMGKGRESSAAAVLPP